MKNAVHVLPESAQSREDFEWLRTEVLAMGGQASIFDGAAMDEADERQVIAEFQAASSVEFSQLKKEIKAMRSRTKIDSDAPATTVVHAIGALQDRFAHAVRRNVFLASGARDVEMALKELAADSHQPSGQRAPSVQPRLSPDEYRRRVWVTRPRPGVDRFSSAWLIRRFIDREATFVFAASPDRYPGAVPFDMYHAGGFRHEGDMCTFEVLQERFGIRDLAVRRIGEIVHDIDLKEDRYKSPHAATIGNLVDGLRASTPDDGRLLEQGIGMFEALYLSFSSTKPRRARRPRC
jgi:hypothetical protein